MSDAAIKSATPTPKAQIIPMNTAGGESSARTKNASSALLAREPRGLGSLGFDSPAAFLLFGVAACLVRVALRLLDRLAAALLFGHQTIQVVCVSANLIGWSRAGFKKQLPVAGCQRTSGLLVVVSAAVKNSPPADFAG
jgi:hypothetical protein